jgi:DNA topoisomerase-1
MRAIDKLLRDGIRRVGTPRSGFRYVAPSGRRPRRPDLGRIRALRIPPAWTDVHVSPLAAAKLQAIGRDRAGRWQYRYNPDFARRRAAAKYRRLLRFAQALPRLRRAVETDMRRRDLSRDRVLAGMVRILESCHMRPGSESYARENRSYGLSTVRPRHVRVAGDLVVFDYRGKSGQRQIRELRHPRVARLVRDLLRVPGRDVFKFVEDGEVVDVRRRHINAYIREAAGAPFTAKDFRTWAGTLLCASELAQAAARGETAAARKRVATAALRSVAARLGNTPAVVRSSYVSPAVLQGFARGRVIGCCLGTDDVIGLAGRGGLHEAERALAELLSASVPRAPQRPALRFVRGGSRGAQTGALRPTGSTAKPLTRAARAEPD